MKTTLTNWEILGSLKIKKNLEADKLIDLLLKNRKISKNDTSDFLNPNLKKISAKSVGINMKELNKSVERIRKAIASKEKIVVYGDYDVDGIAGTAILWESLRDAGADVMPYIPNRIEEGYGLSVKGIEDLEKTLGRPALIITVDNGIVANDAVFFAKERGIDVIITDHHVPSSALPDAYSIVHTTSLCGAGVAYMLSRAISNFPRFAQASRGEQFSISNDSHLELVALATVADLVPLTQANRSLLYFGLKNLRESMRPGLLALFEEAGIKKEEISVYTIGHVIAPRLNAMGRLENAMDSLRLLCTTDPKRARLLAIKLGDTNRSRQKLTIDTFMHAKSRVKGNSKKLLFVKHDSYEQGIIGLVAGRLTEEYFLPSIVVSKGKEISRASARSVSGFNIIEFIRKASDLLVDAGGHPMAAGFTVKTENLTALEKKFQKFAEEMLTEELLKRKLRIDCEIPLRSLNIEVYDSLSKLEPFGMGNPTPVFVSRGLNIYDLRIVGADQRHIKIVCSDGEFSIEAMYFNGVEKLRGIKIGDTVDIAYSLVLNEWNGNKKIELRIKDLIHHGKGH